MTFLSKWPGKHERLGFSSIQGESHAAAKTPNQDAVLAGKNEYGVVLAVADGVGSHAFSQIGSKAAVRAVRDAFYAFEKGQIPVSDITKTIFTYYKRAVPDHLKTQASTTCIFAYLSNTSGLYIGQVGDGACYLKLNGRFTRLKGKDEDFANLVKPLNASMDEAKWKTRHFLVKADDRIEILLATDGISADIIPGKEEACLKFYADDLRRWPRLLSRLRIRRYLKRWNVPGSADDRTMIVYSRG